MRKLAFVALFLGAACSTAPPSDSVTPPGGPYGLTVAEEARILALEDRREYDPRIVAQWAAHPNPLHRIRIALAMGRIGPHTFVDDNGDDRYSLSIESRAGVKELIALSRDPDRRVREMVAFALGEIGDPNGMSTLFAMAGEEDANVAAEAAEALSKFAGSAEFTGEPLDRYLWLTNEHWPEGVRARAIRYLFRFNSDKASAAAMQALASTSTAIRQEAAYALARRAYAPARDQLALLVNDPNVLTRAYAITALGRIGDASSVPPLIGALGDVHPWARTNAAVALGRIFANAPAAVRADDLPRIFAATEDPDPGVRASMIDVLSYYATINRSAHTRYLSIFTNGTQWERELAVSAIPKRFKGSNLSEDETTSTFTPWQIVRYLESSADANGAAFRAAKASHPDALVRAQALAAIPDQSVRAESEIIRKGLEDPDVIVRTNAYDRYGLLRTVEDREVWLKTLKDAEIRERSEAMNDGRLAAINAIAQLDAPGRKEYLSSFLGDRDPVVRRVAATLLAEKHEIFARYTPLPVTRTQKEYEEIARWSRQPHTATIHMTRGTIEIALATQDAPMTAWNFAQLAKKGYYDNSSFMRVVPNFVIQGGDPRNDMNGGPGYAIRDEINLQKYTRGAVGMALSGPDTGGSQFFVTHSPQPHLDGGYTIFGRVYDGMNGVVDQTERGDRVETIRIDEQPPPAAADAAAS